MGNSLKEKILLFLPPRLRENVLLLPALVKPFTSIKKINDIKCISEIAKNHGWGKLSNDVYIWQRAFQRLSLSTKVGYEIALLFFNDNIDIIKLSSCENLLKNDVIVICVVKNDLKRMKAFYKHYRKLGVRKFAILDNNSDDGTFEWLSNQEETDLFQTKIPYTTNRRQAWINRIISFYGFEKWYLVVDSDELLMYEDMENRSIFELTSFETLRKNYRVRTLTVDMYSDKLFTDSTSDEDYISKYIYFDSDNYRETNHCCFQCIDGGMRVRMFKGDNPRFAPVLTKYPLIFFQKGDIQYNSHYSFPFYKNFKSPCRGALFHYKFLSSDMKKYNDIADSGAFYGGSFEYKQYIKVYKKNPEMSLIYKGSKKYIDSNSLRLITNIDKIRW